LESTDDGGCPVAHAVRRCVCWRSAHVALGGAQMFHSRSASSTCAAKTARARGSFRATCRPRTSPTRAPALTMALI